MSDDGTARDLLKTPKKIALEWAEQGIKISERTLRARIRQLGCYREIGKALFLTPDDVVALLEGLKAGPRDPMPSDAPGVSTEEVLALIDRANAKNQPSVRRSRRLRRRTP